MMCGFCLILGTCCSLLLLELAARGRLADMSQIGGFRPFLRKRGPKVPILHVLPKCIDVSPVTPEAIFVN
jgi:hypothetical protein